MKETIQKLSLDDRAKQNAVDEVYLNSKAGIGGHFAITILIPLLLFDELSLSTDLLIFVFLSVILMGRSYIVFKYLKVKRKYLSLFCLHMPWRFYFHL